VLLSGDGALLGAQIASDYQWRFSPLETLPEKYRQALLTFEDQNFYHHLGLDPKAIARAAISNIRRGHIVSGGSTITMQLARMLRQTSLRQAIVENAIAEKLSQTKRLQRRRLHCKPIRT